ncbi:MAG: hypothetical protein ACPG4U_03395 [Pseudomonadales bacterium]
MADTPDLGAILGSLMSGVIQARRISDEQTAELAEYYRENPLLEGLTVPRVRIPEITIDLPLLVEDFIDGEAGEIEPPNKISEKATGELVNKAKIHKITLPAVFKNGFKRDIENRLKKMKSSGAPMVKENIIRNVQGALATQIKTHKLELNSEQQKLISNSIRDTLALENISRKPVAAAIKSNIKTADVKEKSSSTNVVRVKVTFREEGLEWATQASESGGVTRTLQPE